MTTLIYFSLLGHLLGFEVILNYVELKSSFISIRNVFWRLHNSLFDRYAFGFTDAVIPISYRLEQQVHRFSRKPGSLRVPAIADPHRYISKRRQHSSSPYFAFCGSIGHIEIVEFILESFLIYREHGSIGITLIVNGKTEEFTHLSNIIESSGLGDTVKVVSDLTDDELAQVYANAYALLIPLRENVQDEARFPHKIAEYCFAGRPLVSTNFGEVKRLFTDKVNAVVCSKYNPREFSECLRYLSDNPAKADYIGENGRLLASSIFDYSVYALPLVQMVRALSGRS